MKNRVLTLEEVLSRPQGAEVWVEHTTDWRQWDGVHVARCDGMGQLLSLAIKPPTGSGWAASFIKKHLNEFVRVWALPQPPTADELAANPWPEGGT